MRRIIVITGNGKGKTSSAIGCAVRAIGRKWKVGFYQFIKSKDSMYGEHIFFGSGRSMKIIPLGCRGCRKNFDYNDKDVQAAQDGFKRIKDELKKNKYKMLVLDEISYPVNWGWIELSAIMEFIENNNKVDFVLTGRDMPQAIIDMADTVSSVEELKHIYSTGVKAMAGIEY